MPVKIIVPQIGEAISELRLAAWLKQEGDYIRKGEPLFEVDSEKAIVEVEAFVEGTLLEIRVPAGSAVMPQDVVGLIAAADEEPAAGENAPADADSAQKAPRSDGRGAVSPVAQRVAAELGVDPAALTGSGPGGRITAADVRRAAAGTPAVDGRLRPGRVLAAPRARARARELGVTLDGLTGTGVDGMIREADVIAATDRGAPTAVEPLTRQRQTIAARMLASKQNIPHFYLMAEVDMSAAADLRAHCRDRLGWPKAPTYTDLFVRACALALAAMPQVNVSFAEDGIVRQSRINVGVAVGLDDGLIVPVVRDAEACSLAEISAQVRALGERARSGRLKADDLGSKSLVVSNLGMYGIDTFVAIIDMPDPMILAVGRVADRVVPVAGQVVIRPMCTLTLSVDHRVLDGVQGAMYLARIKDYLEHPFELLG